MILFDKVVGQAHIKKYLQKTIKNNRVAHAQIFVGNYGYGLLPMALAYAGNLLAKNSTDRAICLKKIANGNHIDLHFFYPVNTTNSIKKNPTSENFIQEWQQFLQENPYGSLLDWYRKIGIEKKRGRIGKDESQNIAKRLKLKSFDGGFKIMLIWGVEQMNAEASNKLLKLLEEPPKKTVFILLTENIENLLSTIISRCQVVDFRKLSQEEITNALIKQRKIDPQTAQKIAAQSEGSYSTSLKKINEQTQETQFKMWFVTLVRNAFKAKGDITITHKIVALSNEIATQHRDLQIAFLKYALDFFRQALLYNYDIKPLVFFNIKDEKFDLSKFASFIHGNNINDIYKEINETIFHIQRNGAANIILLDLSIKLTRFLHTKEK